MGISENANKMEKWDTEKTICGIFLEKMWNIPCYQNYGNTISKVISPFVILLGDVFTISLQIPHDKSSDLTPPPQNVFKFDKVSEKLISTLLRNTTTENEKGI